MCVGLRRAGEALDGAGFLRKHSQHGYPQHRRRVETVGCSQAKFSIHAAGELSQGHGTWALGGNLYSSRRT